MIIFVETSYFLKFQVCEIGSFTSYFTKKIIPYVKRSFLQLESEFAKNSFASSVDFSKLVCGSAEVKIMVLPLTNKNQEYIDSLKPIALGVNGSLYMICLPHPNEWEHSSLNQCKVYEFNKQLQQWYEVQIVPLIARI
jgi:hypothetical protein